MKPWLPRLATIAALTGITFLVMRYSPRLLPKMELAGVVETGCDLHKRACRATLPGGGNLELSITPRPIPILQPVRIEVAVTGLRPEKVEVDFAGASMNMGYNRGELAITGTGVYAGEASLPVCVSGSMAWIATAIVESGEQRIAVPFRFDTGH